MPRPALLRLRFIAVPALIVLIMVSLSAHSEAGARARHLFWGAWIGSQLTGETPPWRLKPYDLAPPGRKYAVVVDGFRHMDFDPAPGDPEFGARGAALRKLQLAFWDGVLHDDRKAFASLDAQAKASVQTDPVWLRTR